jgi:1D-myo-inositol 3-kinase
MTPDFLVIGHAAQDMREDGTWQLGGAVAYASALASSLSRRTAVLTSASTDVDVASLLPGVDCHVVPSATTTRFYNTYEDGRRRQRVSQRAAPIAVTDLPAAWRDASIVLLGPLVAEIDDALAAAFPQAIVGVGAQGWLREIGPDTIVRPVAPERWDSSLLLKHADALFLSDEDIPAGSTDAAIDRWRGSARIVAFTRGDRGADVYADGELRHIDAFPARVVDLTGAGDVFAAAFLIRLKESGDVWESTRFAACAASHVIEGEGLAGIPTRVQIETRLGDNPGIVAKSA